MRLNILVSISLIACAMGFARAEATSNDKKADELIARARPLIDSGQFQAAQKILTEAIQAAPGRPAPHFFMGLALLRTNRKREAPIELELCRTLPPKTATDFDACGLLSVADYQYKSGINFYNRALQLVPDSPQYLTDRAMAYQRTHESMHMKQDCDKAVARDKTFAPAWYSSSLANLEIQPANGKEALRCIEIAIKLLSTAEYHLYRGSIIQQEHAPQAISEYTKAIKIEPTPYAYIRRAILYFKLGDYEKALADARTACFLSPLEEQPFVMMAACDLKLHHPEKALSDLENTLVAREDTMARDRSSWSMYAIRLLQKKALTDLGLEKSVDKELLASLGPPPSEADSIAIWKSVVSAANDRSAPLAAPASQSPAVAKLVKRMRARLLCEKGEKSAQELETEAALPLYNRAIEIAPDLVRAYLSRAESMTATGKYASALADYTTALKLDPKSTAAGYGCGKTNLATKRFKDAFKQLSQTSSMLRTSPKLDDGENFYQLHFECAKAAFFVNDFPGTIYSATIAIKSKPRGTEALRIRAKAYYARHDWANALADVDKALSLAGDPYKTFLPKGQISAVRSEADMRADCLEKLGRTEEARKQRAFTKGREGEVFDVTPFQDRK